MDPIERLSPRHRQIAALLGMGKSNKEIACALSLSTHTIQCHLHEMYVRTGFRNRAELGSMFMIWMMIQRELQKGIRDASPDPPLPPHLVSHDTKPLAS